MSPRRTRAQAALNFAPSREAFIAALGTTEAEAYDTIEKTIPHFTALMQARAVLRGCGWEGARRVRSREDFVRARRRRCMTSLSGVKSRHDDGNAAPDAGEPRWRTARERATMSGSSPPRHQIVVPSDALTHMKQVSLFGVHYARFASMSL